MVPGATVCEALTVAVHVPVVQGLGTMDTMYVPAVTPVPAIMLPTLREPVVMAVMDSVVDEMDPVSTPATPLQKKPAGHATGAPTPGAQKEPVVHSVGSAEPAGQEEPAGHGTCDVPPVVEGQ